MGSWSFPGSVRQHIVAGYATCMLEPAAQDEGARHLEG